MADVAALAQEAEERHRATSLAARPRPAAGASAHHCGSCGEPIPEARRAAMPGCRLCAFCAALGAR